MIYLYLVLIFFTGVFLFLKTPRFGKTPKGKRLKRIQKLPNYQQGKFQNINPTPDFTQGATYGSVMREFFFNKDKRNIPSAPIPAQKIDLFSIPADEDCIVWFGHSSYFLQVGGKKFLVDPVLNGTASPIAATTRSFKGSDQYSVNDIPNPDYLIITHDHWDHLDYRTVKALQSRTNKVVCPIGVGEHLEHWGYKNAQLIEHNWYESEELEPGFSIHFTPARHFSGRGFKRQSSLWTSYVLKTPNKRLFLGGDSGYDSHFKEIGKQFGPFDLAILECGQYNKNWEYIHMMPEQVVQAALDLKTEYLFPVHWGKFSLSMHAWDEPIKRVTQAAKDHPIKLMLPQIGEKNPLEGRDYQEFWWENLAD